MPVRQYGPEEVATHAPVPEEAAPKLALLPPVNPGNYRQPFGEVETPELRCTEGSVTFVTARGALTYAKSLAEYSLPHMRKENDTEGIAIAEQILAIEYQDGEGGDEFDAPPHTDRERRLLLLPRSSFGSPPYMDDALAAYIRFSGDMSPYPIILAADRRAWKRHAFSHNERDHARGELPASAETFHDIAQWYVSPPLSETVPIRQYSAAEVRKPE